uniref:NADH-ubiquinone oxidoreductase chain 6 n=1 Tax=Nephrops norvegicus TaxID=6829 RepID=A0A0A8WDX0_NEPNO|nr:NADH dehydrogenase subunit 6 [Nephrops norvegicus]CEK40204.1 NADH dehydrogenase subunit 6 [Nephrops norvegicus]
MKLFSEILFFILPLIFTTALLFTRLIHPLSMGLTLLMQTVMISLASGLNNNSFWFSYILFLIFLGAMLVLFIYVASLASNEPFKFSTTALMITLGVSFFLTATMLLKDPLYGTPDISILSSSVALDMFSLDTTSSLVSTIYSPPTMSFTLFMVLYLLLTLIVIVKIVNLYSSPLRLSY